jgi:hypothetical protein
MREAFEASYEPSNWFSPLLNPGGWFDDTLVVDDADASVAIVGSATEQPDTATGTIRVPRKPVVGGNWPAQSYWPQPEPKQRVSIIGWVREAPDGAITDKPVACEPMTPEELVEHDNLFVLGLLLPD